MTDQKQRPTFLTVLCILTWVGSGLVLLGQLFALASAPMVKASKDILESSEIEEAMGELSSEAPAFGGIMQKFMGQGMQALENYKSLILVKVIGVLLVLFGAILMWKLKKTGFYLFVGGKLVILIGVFVLMGAGGMAFLSISGSLIVAIAFTIMYAVNLKAMN